MIKRYVVVLILIIFSFSLLYQSATAKEATAQMKLKKIAVPAKRLFTYTVKEGDTVSNILRKIPGITEKRLARNYRIIKELNQNVSDLDKLEVGQSLILPGKPVT
jgi:nucleoid-associated protein YgaU